MEGDGTQLQIVAVNLITSNVPVSSTEIELICSESSKDPTFTVLRHYINIGWPSECRKLPQELHTFWKYREDLSVERWTNYQGYKTSHTFHTQKEDLGTNT